MKIKDKTKQRYIFTRFYQKIINVCTTKISSLAVIKNLNLYIFSYTVIMHINEILNIKKNPASRIFSFSDILFIGQVICVIFFFYYY